MKEFDELRLELQDAEWPLTYTDHDRNIVGAIVVDGAGSSGRSWAWRWRSWPKSAW